VYPALQQLRQLEKQTLTSLAELAEFSRFGQLRAEAKRAAGEINEHRGSVDINLGFTLDIRLRGERRPAPRRVDLGALVVASDDNKHVRNSSYSLIICRRSDPATSPIVRKVHFDYEPLDYRNQREPKPSAHLQICGRYSRHHLTAGYAEARLAKLYPGWEKPRIPLAPTSLALLMNWLLLEFQSDPGSQAALRSPGWRKLVAAAERLVLLPYYAGAVDFLRGAANQDRRLMQSYLYGTPSD
jgi:hypothetical protein